MSAAPSPGPWRRVIADTGEVAVYDAAGNLVCTMAGNNNDGKNGRQISATTDMLAVLLKLRRGDLHQRVRHLYDEAQAAIAKAGSAS